MNKTLIALMLAVALSGCKKPAEETMKAGSEFEVERLFTADGCTVYRFYDGGYKYFTNCRGDTSWRESCGKGCNREEGVSGGKQ